MTKDLRGIDSAWAWSPYEPDERRPWNRAAAAHLFRRAGFGAAWDELQRAAQQSPHEVIEELLHPGEDAAQFQRQAEALGQNVLAGGNVGGLSAWWLHVMLHTPDPLLEKLALFWHGHFATSAAKVNDARLMYQQHQLFRRHGRGNFGPLVKAVACDPAMLIYLDAAANRKTHPNENFARELMELFCLGPGNYAEQDVQELARAYTGWEVHRKKFVFNEYEHDAGRKTILGRTGRFGGEEAVGLVLAHEAAPRFIAGMLFRYFICDEPAPPAALIEPLAVQLRESDFDVLATLETIFRSRLFFSQHAVGRKVRSPVELAIGLMRALRTHGNMNELAQRLGELGQRPFYPPSVKGWDGGRTWINTATLLGRANLVREIVRGAELEKLPPRAGSRSPEEIVDWALELLVAVPVPGGVRASLVEIAKRKQDGPRRTADVLHAVGVLPEFQLC